MSELKAFNCVESDVQEFCEPRLVYLKSEADKVIADKNKEIAELQKKVYDYALDSYVIQSKAETKIEHHKYKRCLAMANYWVAVSYHCVDCKHRQKAEKRHYKWLELAEKFKEGV